MTNLTDPDLDKTIRQLFPLPSIEALKQEAASETIPFGHFGASGGFGPIRAVLVEAIAANDQTEIESKYYALIADGIQDEFSEYMFDQDHSLKPDKTPLSIISFAHDLALAMKEMQVN